MKNMPAVQSPIKTPITSANTHRMKNLIFSAFCKVTGPEHASICVDFAISSKIKQITSAEMEECVLCCIIHAINKPFIYRGIRMMVICHNKYYRTNFKKKIFLFIFFVLFCSKSFNIHAIY